MWERSKFGFGFGAECAGVDDFDLTPHNPDHSFGLKTGQVAAHDLSNGAQAPCDLFVGVRNTCRAGTGFGDSIQKRSGQPLAHAAEGDAFNKRHQLAETMADDSEDFQRHAGVFLAEAAEGLLSDEEGGGFANRGDGSGVRPVVEQRDLGDARRGAFDGEHDLTAAGTGLQDLDSARAEDPESLAGVPFMKESLRGREGLLDGERGNGEPLFRRKRGKQRRREECVAPEFR